MLPYGAGRQVAKRAKVSEGMVSLVFTGKVKNLRSEACRKIIHEALELIEEHRKKDVTLNRAIEKTATN